MQENQQPPLAAAARLGIEPLLQIADLTLQRADFGQGLHLVLRPGDDAAGVHGRQVELWSDAQ